MYIEDKDEIIAEMKRDDHYDDLEQFYNLNRHIEKDFHELNEYEIAQVERDYKKYIEEIEEYSHPNRYFGVER